MADLAVVALGLDATGMTAGAAQANRALQSVENEMSKAEQQSGHLGNALSKTGTSAQGFNTSITKSAQALSGLGGPVGQAAGQLQGLGGQLDGLVESFGAVGGAAVAAVAGVVALGAGLLKLTLDGVKLSDEIGDIGQALGFTQEQMERLNSAARISGESLSFVERSFGQFENAIKQGISDPASDAAQALIKLGVDAKKAATDPQTAFLSLLSTLSDVTKSFDTQQAAHEIFSRSTAVMIRVSEEYRNQLKLTQDQLVALGFATGATSQQMASDIDKNINTISLQFDTLKRQLVSDVGPALLEFFKEQIKAIREFRAVLEGFKSGGIGGAVVAGIKFEREQAISQQQAENQRRFGGLFALGQSEPGVDTTIPGVGVIAGKTKLPGGTAARDTSAQRIAEQAAREAKKELEASIDRKNAADKVIKETEDLATALNKLNASTALNTPSGTVDTIFEKFLRLGLGTTTLPGVAAPPTTAGAIPGALNVGALGPSQILSAREARIQQSLGGVLEDFVFQITSARSTVSDAFKGFMLGITDTFAAEFAKSVQESLQTSFIKPLASWLEDALKSIFEGIDLKGVSKFFLTLGKSFVGLFAEGGTIPPGHWGIAGERGAEVVYSGSQSMHIAPMGGGGGGVTINFAISTPTGEVSQRTQDQIADAAARGIERSQRLRGAR